MIDVYFWPTPNGLKIKLFMEETGMTCRYLPVDIGKGDQFKPEFLAISPNNKIPAIVDHVPAVGSEPLAVFESGAILLYLAEKTGKLLPKDVHGRMQTLQWLFWQVGGLGPMAGQNGHFRVYAPELLPYAIERYTNETNRLFGVLNKQLADHEFICGDYSIADIACYPWVVPYRGLGQLLTQFPNLKRWFETIAARPAVLRTYEGVKEPYTQRAHFSEEERKLLFGQTAARNSQ